MKKVLWLVVSCLMALSLVLAACGPAATPTTSAPASTAPAATTPLTATTPPTAAPTTQPSQAPQASSDVPQYGGTYTEATATSPIGFDPLVVPTNSCPTLQFTHDTLLGGDWTKGPAGTGQTDWLYGILGNTSLYAGQLATSWEIPDSTTIIYHIRQGVHWQNKAPVNGREMTASDIAWTLQSEWTTPGTNWDIFFAKPDRTISVNATDKYTVLVKVPQGTLGTNFLENSERGFIRAPEPTAVYGNQNDWRNQNTTGPFYISDYVPGSIITYTKNPNYWEKDPVGPGKGNQLPYADHVVQLVIPDTSTRLAAFRVGKIDLMKSQTWDDTADLLKRNPSLKSVQVVGSALFLAGRVDKPDLPFKDVNVRRALNMAVNKQEIVDQYYNGKADIYGYPFPNTPAYSAFYTPFKDLPASVQELYTYNPDKAKQLLTAAGYPNGFKVNIVVSSIGTNVDYVAMVKSYLDKVGVNLTIQPMDNAAYTTLTNNKNYDMIARGTTLASLPYMLHEGRIDSQGDFANWQDAASLATYKVIQQNLITNDAAWIKAVHDLTPDLLDQAWGIFMPQPYVYHVWWPWVKNFHGEVQTGYARFNRNIRYLWIDQNLKKTMGY